MSCLNDINLVGLRDACGDDLIAPSSGYYLNDLPGIELGVVAASANKEQRNALEAIQRQIALAENLTLDTFRGALKQRWSVNSILSNRVSGQLDVATAQAAQAYKVGQYLKATGNAYGELNVSQISLLVNYTGNVAVKAWDVTTGIELQSETFAVAAGVPTTKSLTWNFGGSGQDIKVFIGYDATSVATYRTTINNSACYTCKGGFFDFGAVQTYTRRVASGDSVLESRLRAQTGTSGISITFGLNCSIDPVLCSMQSTLAPIIAYKAAALICALMKYSKRLTPDVMLFKGDHEELADDYEAAYNGLLSAALENAIIPKGPCFKCQSPINLRKSG